MEAQRLEPIPLRQIRIDDPFWSRYTRLVTDKMLPYQWRALLDIVGSRI